MLKVGTEAPNFAAPLDDGGTFRLSDWRGRTNIVLYFYPRDNTRGCTREACGFRDHHAEISRARAIVVGVSPDPPESHRRFREGLDLPFPLVSDSDRRVSRRYDARALFGRMTARVTYVIDRQGTIRGAFRHELSIDDHVRDVLATLHGLDHQSTSP